MIKTEPLTSCCACGSTTLTELLRLEKFPHIGIYLKNADDATRFPKVDNSVNYCKECGHIQLGVTVDPAFLYTTEFQHKTSQSASAKQANEFLYTFAEKVFGGRAYPTSVVEIGCNDTFLLQKFVDKGAQAIGVDPILKGREAQFLAGVAAEHKSKFRVIGDFVEKISFDAALGGAPDLFITNFVFEHLREPFAVTASLVEKMGDNSIAMIGVPGAEFMVYNSRFDQLSHQHYQQFNLQSLMRMITRAGGEIVDHAINFTNWGQLIVAFKKRKTVQKGTEYKAPYDLKEVQTSVTLFKEHLKSLETRLNLLARSKKPMFGFGAAQNFPIFEYFFGKTMPFTEILDDHPLRQNHTFPHLGYRICAPREHYEGAVGVLTGPDYSRVLVPRMAQLRFDHIVVPFSAN